MSSFLKRAGEDVCMHFLTYLEQHKDISVPYGGSIKVISDDSRCQCVDCVDSIPPELLSLLLKLNHLHGLQNVLWDDL